MSHATTPPTISTPAATASIHHGKAFGSVTTVSGISTATTGPSAKSSFGFAAETASKRNWKDSAGCDVVGVDTGAGLLKLTVKLSVAPAARSRSTSPSILSHDI